MSKDGPIERAFALARSGQCRSISEIIRRLAPEDREAVEAYLAVHKHRREMILTCSEAWLAVR
jgi:hypothetical protein